jgi:hypothetical protein
VSPGASRAAVSSLTASDPLLTVETQADYKASLNRSVDHVLELVGALLGLAVVIALFALYAAVGACAALGAAVLPARRAARTSVVAAMAEA